MSRGSARTLQHWLGKGYEKEEAEKMRLSRVPGTIEYFTIFKGMDLDEAKVAKIKYQSKRVNTLENMIKKHGEIDGKIKWDEYREKQAHSNSFEYKKKKYGWTKEQFDEFNKSRGASGERNGNYGSSYYQVWVDKFGVEIADEMNKEVSKLKIRTGEDSGNYKRPKRTEELRRMRKSAIKRIERNVFNGGQMMPGYNPEACKLIEQYGKENGYNFQHAENGGEYHIKELGYFVDGYDKEKNVVIEYYEPFHKKQVERDERRKQEIIDHLGCKFIEIKE